MPERPSICEACGINIPPHEHYVVQIDVYADPSMPAIDTSAVEPTQTSKSIDTLLTQMKSMTADELQDGVHRRFYYLVCHACQKDFLANPLGRPRPRAKRAPGDN